MNGKKKNDFRARHTGESNVLRVIQICNVYIFICTSFHINNKIKSIDLIKNQEIFINNKGDKIKYCLNKRSLRL